MIFPGCYDLNSLKASSELSKKGENTVAYTLLFGNSKISVERLFPLTEEPFVVYDNSKEDYSYITTTHSPIVVCDYTISSRRGVCSFSVLKIEVYT